MPIPEPCKLLLVDDHVLFRDRLKLAFRPIPGLVVVGKGSAYLSSRLSRSEVDACRKRATARDSTIASLTPREREVFELVVQGLTSAQIGDRLGTSPRTVETHRIRILHKLRAKSVLDLARIAAQRGLLKGWN